MTKGTVRVLVVDDDDSIRATLQLIVEEGGYEALAASSGVEALAALRAAEERLVVLLDVMMPRMDGLDVLRMVDEEPELQRHVYLLVTAGGKTLPLADAQRVRRLGVRVIYKPFDLDGLLEAVDEAARQVRES